MAILKGTLTFTACLSLLITVKTQVIDIGNDKFIPPYDGNAIFFIDTTYWNGVGRVNLTLTNRQACAIESAARLHPNHAIYILFTSLPMKKNSQLHLDPKSPLGIVHDYGNVEIVRVPLEIYADDTPLETWFPEAMIAGNITDEMRSIQVKFALIFLTMWKYAGIYLDMDVICVKRLDSIRGNWVASLSDELIGTGAMKFTRSVFARLMTNFIIKDYKRTFLKYNTDSNRLMTYKKIFTYHGPGVMTRVFSRVCGTGSVREMTADMCLGFRVLHPDYFTPVKLDKWADYYHPGSLQRIISTKKTVAYQVWTEHYFKRVDKLRNDVPYVFLANNYCPRVTNAIVDEF